MKLPEDAKPPKNIIMPFSQSDAYIPDKAEAYIPNIMYQNEYLTQEQALTLIHNLAGILIIDGKHRKNKTEYKKYL